MAVNETAKVSRSAEKLQITRQALAATPADRQGSRDFDMTARMKMSMGCRHHQPDEGKWCARSLIVLVFSSQHTNPNPGLLAVISGDVFADQTGDAGPR